MTWHFADETAVTGRWLPSDQWGLPYRDQRYQTVYLRLEVGEDVFLDAVVSRAQWEADIGDGQLLEPFNETDHFGSLAAAMMAAERYVRWENDISNRGRARSYVGWLTRWDQLKNWRFERKLSSHYGSPGATLFRTLLEERIANAPSPLLSESQNVEVQ